MDRRLGHHHSEGEALFEVELGRCSASWLEYPTDRSSPDSKRKSPPLMLTTTAPSTPGAQTIGPPRIWRRWSNTTRPPCSVVSTTPV